MKTSIIIPPIFSINSLKKIFYEISKQSYDCYEVILVCDPGIECDAIIKLAQNMGLRIKIVKNTANNENPIYLAFLESNGNVITVIDCIDEIPPEKFELVDKIFTSNPGVGGVRSGYVKKDVNNDIYSLSVSYSNPSLEDILLGDPEYFSDGFFRREWYEGFFSDKVNADSCQISLLALKFYSYSILSGCNIAGWNKIINVRHNSDIVDVNIKMITEQSVKCMDDLFSNPKYEGLIALRKDKAIAHTYLRWSLEAFAMHETELGQELFRKSIELNRSILDIGAQGFFNLLIRKAIQKREPIDTFLKKIVSQLTPEFAWLSRYLDDAISRGHFYRSISELAFGRARIAYQDVHQLKRYGYKLRKSDLMTALSILSEYEKVYGSEAVKSVLKKLTQFRRLINTKDIRWLKSTRLVNNAYENYRANCFQRVPIEIINAVFINPKCLLNSGIVSIFINSLNEIIRNYISRKQEILIDLRNINL